MINEENLNKLYNGIVTGHELTTKELNSYGFNSKDLAILIEKGILVRVKKGYYEFKDTEELFLYGKKLISAKEYEKASICFEKCYKLNPNHSGACLQLFLKSINDKDYESTFKYLEVLQETENTYYKADINFYLYLLSMITNLPTKYQEYVRHLTFEDIKIDNFDQRNKYAKYQNQIRSSVLKRKFPYALKQLKELTNTKGSSSKQDIIVKMLLFQAIEVETISKNTLLELAKHKSYEEIIKFLKDKEKQHTLSLTDSYTMRLAKELINLKQTKKLAKISIYQTEQLFEAIDGNNYELALKLSNNYNLKNNINNSENTINLLLQDICYLIKEIFAKQEISESKKQDEVITTKKQTTTAKTSTISSTTSFFDIVNFLVKSDIENAFKSLRNYMESINKKEYEFLIIDLIKLSLIEKDIAFTKPMLTLTYISRENYQFDISNYIQEFYISLAQNQFDSARIYLDIISKSEKLVKENIFTDGLLQALNKAETIIDSKQTISILENPKETLTEKHDVNNTQRTVNKKENSHIKVEEETEVVVENLSQTTRDSEKEFIQNKYDILLKNHGIVLLRPMNNERRRSVHQIVKEYPNMVSFSIGEEPKRQIVLRYKPQESEYIDIKKIIDTGNLAYNQGNYDLCIENYLQLLELKNPKTFIYGKLGLAYMKKGKKDKAIEYLTVATELSKQENGKLDFTELLASLNGLIDEKDKKPRFKMGIEEFERDNQNNYGIKNINDITSYALTHNLDIESSCKELNMNDEQINIVKLIYAREFYTQGNYDIGDQFLHSVEKSKNKTKIIVTLLEEIRRSKKFYINRISENSPKLVLTLKP